MEVIIVDQTHQPTEQETLQSVLGAVSASPRLIYHWICDRLPQARNVGVNCLRAISFSLLMDAA